MPPGEPVPAAFVNAFTSDRDRFLTLLYSPTALRAANND